MKRLVVYFVIFWASFNVVAEACAVSGNDWSSSLNEALLALKVGDNHKFKSTIQKSIKFKDIKELDALLEDVKGYAPQGFNKCRELMRVDIPPLVTKMLFEFVVDEQKGIYFYVFLIDGDVSYRSGIMQFRITTSLEDVLRDWGN